MATKTLAQLIAGARQYANVENSLFVDDATELPARTNEAIAELYELVVSAYEHYYVSSSTFVLAGGTAGNTFDTRTLVGGFFKDNTLENISDPSRPRLVRRIATFMSRHRGFVPGYALVGDLLTVYPPDNSAGTYRLYYTPDAPILASIAGATKTAERATTTVLPPNTYTGAGVGSGFTATANGLLSLDGGGVSAGQTLLIKDEVNQAHNGLFDVVLPGSGVTPFILVRTPAYDQPTEITVGDTIAVTNGLTNAGTVWRLNTFSGLVDVASQIYGLAPQQLDATLSKWFPYVELHVARYILDKREMDSAPMNSRLLQMKQRVLEMSRNRTEEAEQAPLNDGHRLWWGDGSELP